MPDEINHINPDKLVDVEQLRKAVVILLNLVETLTAQNLANQKEIQELKDTINLLKGEQGRPQITGSGKKPNKDVSSKGKEKERQEAKPEKQPIPIDRQPPVLTMGADELPPDARLNNYRTVVVQDLIFKRDNVEYTLAVYYSPSLHTTFEAPLPLEHRQGHYGSSLKSFIQIMNRACNVTESGIEQLLKNLGIQISSGTISNLLLEPEEWVCE